MTLSSRKKDVRKMIEVPKTIKQSALFSLVALGALGVTAVPASAHYYTTRYDRDGDSCYRVYCDDDGDNCQREIGRAHV